ncbi:AtpZ/AtpI family protein [Pseudooceanicola sp. 502str34]|uniref:AtpZ/AtpI family protein n=1 Tax=Maritimibacter alkaliphilus TaxID=404236 RepID=UPI001C96A0AA|nr:AtpZ/AtpI family protein [Maritimibacter alkaliphilus]MBY6088903.1 AtpZ/AtpI family protein [Maritimibacter alkaliphilus]
MSDQDHKARMAALEAKIAAAKKAVEPPAPSESHYNQAQVAWRMVTELVAGLGLGFAIGFGLDTLFGTKPILLVVFTMLGMAAGVQTMIRTARELERKHAAETAGTNDESGQSPRDGEGH